MRTLLLLALAAPLSAHGVHVVGGDAPEFPNIQAAVDAAADGDTVVVFPGPYPGFTLDGKGVSIVGLEVDGARPMINGDVAVHGLAAAQSAVLRGFDFAVGASAALTDNAGAVLLEELEGWGTLDVVGSLDVVLVRTFFFTVDVHGSALHAYEAKFSGGSDGGTGLRVVDGFAFLSGSQVQGGLGSQGFSGTFSIPTCSDGGKGGIGLYLENSQVYRLDTVIGGGAGGPPGIGKVGPPCSAGAPGPAIVGSGVVNLPGTARDFEISSPGIEDEAVHLRAAGPAGEFVYVLVGATLDPAWFPAWSGTVSVPFSSLLLFAGVLPAQGEIAADVAVGELGAGIDGVQIFAQGLFVSLPGGVAVHAGPPSGVELLDRDAILFDCNGNGLQDATDIASGTSKDCNGNAKPDECDIAAGAAPDCNGNAVPDECDIASGTSHDANGNGQPDECEGPALVVPSALYPTIQDAVNAAPDKATVLVRAGVYSLTSVTVDKDIIIRSQHGAGATVLEGVGFFAGFRLDEAEDTATVQGFTLRGFSVGAIQVEDGGGRILDCVFEDNLGAGAVKIEIGDLSSSGVYGQPKIRIERCTFQGNRHLETVGSGAIDALALGENPFDLTVSGCRFTGNSVAGLGYGALGVARGNLTLRNSSFTANTGPWGTVGHRLPLHALGTSLVQGVTIWGNDAGPGATPALFIDGLDQPHKVLVANSIVRQNQPAGAAEIGLWSPEAAVEWTNVEGGPAGVKGLGTLTYGPGNLDLDPLFVSPAGGDLHLSLASPCIDAGDPSYIPLAGEKDFDGQARVFGPAIDMGADEVHP